MQFAVKQIAIAVAMMGSTAAWAANQTIQADIAVIGAGFAGLSAATDAANSGKKVVVLEKSAFIAGASALCGGQYAIQGSETQKEKGVPYDPPQSLVHDLIANGHLTNNLTTLNLFAQNSPRVANWAIERFNPGRVQV